MNVYLAGTSAVKKGFAENRINLGEANVLESFFSIKDWQISLVPKFKNFMLDSGAFTFRYGNKRIDWEDYTKRYAQFVKDNEIEYFFEMDIDNIVGYEEVLRLRRILEFIAEKKSIPVWHISRGKENFVRMCKEYEYVAMGGFAGGVLEKTNFLNHVPWFIKVAHDNGCKIHGLGFTILEKLKFCKFDSVDSTTWLSGARYGQLHYFNGKSIKKINSIVNGLKVRKIKDVRYVNEFNFKEWLKFLKYAEYNL